MAGITLSRSLHSPEPLRQTLEAVWIVVGSGCVYEILNIRELVRT
jgi:hypothetical protein